MSNSKRTVAGGLLGLHALTSLHPGSGTALGTVDLPVQRERHTQWPNITGGSIKGVLRDVCRELELQEDATLTDDPDQDLTKRDRANEAPKITDIFGPPAKPDRDLAAGAISVTDGRLLAYPVRSLKGIYALVSCPSVLDRLHRDASLAGVDLPTTSFDKLEPNQAVVASSGCDCLTSDTDMLLEEYHFTKAEGDCKEIAEWIAKKLLPDNAAYKGTCERFPRRFVVLHDDDYTHFVQHATEVTARIGLDYDTKTVRDGALFYQEFLPAESLFYTVILANAVRARFGTKEATTILQDLREYLERVPVLQLGGDETTGKGYCSTQFFSPNGGN